MRAGLLRERITIQTAGPTQNEIGEMVAGWVDAYTNVPASIFDVSGKEYVAAGATQSSANTKITIRYQAGIVPAMRVLHGAVAYNVESVLGQDRKSLLLMCVRAA